MFKINHLGLRLLGCALLGLATSLFTGPSARAGTFQSDFDSGIPPGVNLFGEAATLDDTSGGYGNNGGVLKITDLAGSVTGSASIDDFDSGEPIAGFDATFQFYMGSGSGADGFSFYYGDFADNSGYGEEGPGAGAINGLTVTFDEYNNGGTPPEAPAIDVKWDGVTVFHRLIGATGTTTPASPLGTATTDRTQTTAGGAPVYWPVHIHVDPDGTLDLTYNSILIVTNFPIFHPMTNTPVHGPAFRFGMSARNGGSTDNKWIDNLNITTYPVDATSGQPYISAISQVPVGANAGAAGGVAVELTDDTYSVVPSSVQLKYNNSTVTPTVTQSGDVTRIAYFGNNGVLPTGAATVTVSYTTTSTPAFNNSFSWNFVVDPFTTIPAGDALASVDTNQPGFTLRVHQMDLPRSPGSVGLIVNVERQLADGYVDPDTGNPYPNVADLTLAETDGTFIDSDVINFEYNGAAAGNFTANSTPSRPDATFPGIPGTSGSTANFVIEFDTILFLKAGGQRFGVNSDDGFTVSFGPGWNAPTAALVGNFNGTRGAADTLFDVVIPQDGYYPVRLTYNQGGGGSSMEFFWIDPTTGQKVLVNDPENLDAPRAYRVSAVSRPSITSVLPVQNWIGAFPDDDVVIKITDGALPLTSGSVLVSINGVAQTVTANKSGKVTTIKRAGSVANLLPSGLNNVSVVYGFNENGGAVTLTNNYSFTVAPYYGRLPAGNMVDNGQVSGIGFHAYVDQMDKSGDANQGNGARINGGWDSNRMPFPEMQLAGGEINPTNGLRYPNLAALSPDNNWDYDIGDFINFGMSSAAVPADGGLFTAAVPAGLPGAQSDMAFPGLPGKGTSYQGLENYIMEVTTYLELKQGVYVFGFNSDDGFVARSGPDAHDTLGTLLGFYNGGRGVSTSLVLPVGQNPPVITPFVSSGSTLFSVIVPADGTYPFRILYWQGGTGIGAEFFTLNKQNGQILLVDDLGSGSPVFAHTTYTGPARPWVKFSVSPSPWENAVQQSGPGPITMVGRTRNAVNSSDIYNLANTTYLSRPWADVAIGGVIANGTSDQNLGLVLDGAPVAATKTTSGTDVTVSYKPNPPLPSGSTHTAGLIYGGTTNYWTFTVQTYTNLNASDAQPLTAANPDNRGFRIKMTQLAAAPPNANQAPTAEAQLAGLLGANLVPPGPGPDGTYIETNIINWSNYGYPGSGKVAAPIGNFQENTYGAAAGWPFPFYTDQPLPGISKTNSYTDYLAAEVFAYLAFPSPGYYRFGVNSDDGFALKVGTPGQTNGTVIASLNLGKGSSDVPVSFMVPEAGLYPIRLLYYNGTGGADLEFFSYDDNGNKIPINDANNPNSIKAYYAVAGTERPNITGATVTGGNITVTWTGGGTLLSAPSLSGPWTTTGNSSGTFSEPATGMKFYRVQK